VGRKHAEHQVVVGAPPEACFDALTDYETFPEWQEAVRSVDVVTRYPGGLGREVAFAIDAKVKQIPTRSSTRTSSRTGSRGTTCAAT
jgi:hypothetical protein